MTLTRNAAVCSFDDLIVAQASAPGSSPRGIVRLSGSNVLNVLAPFLSLTNPFDAPNSFGVSNRSARLDRNPNDSSRTFDGRILVADRDKTAVLDVWFRPWKIEEDRSFDPRILTLSILRDGKTSSPLSDEVLGDKSSNDEFLQNDARTVARRFVPCRLYYWPNGRGFTGQTSSELHLPGSPPILEAVVRNLCASGFARLATPGEFTLRAFLAGRIDLTQAEAVLGVIDANDERNLKTALDQLAGGVGKPLAAVREQLFQLLCDLEAGLDFSEEEIEFVGRDEILRRLDSAKNQIARTLAQTEARTAIESRSRVVLLGRPNGGKSSLFNRMIQTFSSDGSVAENIESSVQNVANSGSKTRTSAIVSDVAGTTRDYLETKLSANDFSFTLVDTAGIDDFDFDVFIESGKNNDGSSPETSASSSPERKARRSTEFARRGANLILFCCDATSLNADRDCDALLEEACRLGKNDSTFVVLTKADAISSDISLDEIRMKFQRMISIRQEFSTIPRILTTSARTGEGIVSLGDAIRNFFNDSNRFSEVVPSTANRCRESLRLAFDSLDLAWKLVDSSEDDILTASEIRVALDQLGLVLGSVHTEDVLDRIFSRFCIGK